MPLSININVNNSNMSIKNEKTGGKKNIKSINAANLNAMTDREQKIDEKRKSARKQAMKLISDAWGKDEKTSDKIKDLYKQKSDVVSEITDLKAKLKDIDKSKDVLRQQYGVDEDSQEQKDLELLMKYQDNKTGASYDDFSEDEIKRLKELQSEPLTEYQKKALMINAGKDSIYADIDKSENKAKRLLQNINNSKLEQLASQDMLKADEAADSVIGAAEKDIFGMLINEGKQNIDDKVEEDKEKADEAEKEKEERQEQIDEAKEKRKEEKEIIESQAESDKLDLETSLKDQKVDHLSEAQKQVVQIMNENKMINEDIKGIEIDLNF